MQMERSLLVNMSRTRVPKESVPKYLVNRLVHLAKVTQLVSSFIRPSLVWAVS